MADEDLFGTGRLDDVMRQVAAEGGEGFRADHFVSREDNMAAGYLIAKGKLEVIGGGGNEPYVVRVKGSGAAVFAEHRRGSPSKARELEMVATRVVEEPAYNSTTVSVKEPEPEPEPEPAKKGLSALDHAREALQYIHTIAESLGAAQEAAGAGLRKMAGVEIDGDDS